MNLPTAKAMILVGSLLLVLDASLYVKQLIPNQTESLSVGSFNTTYVNFHFQGHMAVYCTVTVGHGNEQISTVVRDPIGKIMYAGVIYGRESFVVNAEREGTHFFSFVNVQDTNKTVYLTLEKDILDASVIVALLVVSLVLVVGGLARDYLCSRAQLDKVEYEIW